MRVGISGQSSVRKEQSRQGLAGVVQSCGPSKGRGETLSPKNKKENDRGRQSQAHTHSHTQTTHRQCWKADFKARVYRVSFRIANALQRNHDLKS